MIWTLPVSSKGQVTLPLALRNHMGIVKIPARVVVEKSPEGALIRSFSPYKLSDLYGIAKQKTIVENMEELISEGVNQMAEEVSQEGVR